MIKIINQKIVDCYKSLILTILLTILEKDFKIKLVKIIIRSWTVLSYSLIIYYGNRIAISNSILRSSVIIYIFILIFILISRKSYVREILNLMDKSLGRKIKYTCNQCCELTLQNIINIFDKFTLAHFFGHFVKGLLLRNYLMCWINSVVFELIEISLRPHIFEFHECWWDSIFHDILLCNASGIYLGVNLCKLLKIKLYNWNLMNSNSLENLKRYFIMIGLSGFFLLFEVNTFYLKDLLFIPSNHYLVILRLILQSIIGSFAIDEVYTFFLEKKRIDLFYFPAVLIAIFQEFLICVVFAKGEFENVIPGYVWILWAIGVTLIILLPFVVLLKKLIFKKYFC
ncbi:Phosphatidylserine synthase 2 [Dictyocoela muelleri]|nr:Phosphatidylserine synthase 2 [Dictyocoela muelleri]